jgi:hypothetical protein
MATAQSPGQVQTIFKDAMVPDFVIKMKESDPQTLQWPVLKSDFFYMMLSSKSEKLSKFYLQISDGRIYMRNSAEHPLLAYIDIAYSRLKLMRNVELCGKTLHGIRFIKSKNYEEIYHPEPRVIDEWFHLLKRYCVLSKFRESYLIKNTIGKGNFAKVYITTRVAENKDFAVKIFDKKLILQDKFERVGLAPYLAMSSIRIKDDERG